MIKTEETTIKQNKLAFSYLPAYADFLLQNKLEEFSSVMLRVSCEENLPILKYFETLTREQIIKLSIETSRELLECFSKNEAQKYIEISQKKWMENQLPHLLQSESILVGDITKISFTRRKVFNSFISSYTSEMATCINIMEEIDRFTTFQEESSFEILMNINKQKLNENHYFVEKINNTSPGIIYVFDLLEQKQIYSNNKKEALLGYNDDELKEKGTDLFSSLIHPKEQALLQKHYKDFSTAKDGEIRTIENRIKNKKGRYRWFREYETVFKRTADGTPSQIIGIAIDISKEKEALLQLEYRDQQLQEAQEIAGLGTFEWDLKGTDSTFSPQLMKIFELKEAENLGSFLEYIHPDDQEILKQAINNSMVNNGYYECQYRYKKNQHAKVIWSRGMVKYQDGKPSKMHGFVMDVTRNHLLNEQLTENETTFRQLIQNAPDAVVVIDENNKILLWNPKAENIFGWKAKEIIGNKLAQTIIPTQYAEHLEGINGLKLSDQSNVSNKTIEIPVVSKKGKEFFVALSIASSLWNGKKVFISFIRDISKVKKVEKELELHRKQLTQKNIELEQINSELTSFNYVASHDLKEPLRKIKTYSNFIIEKNNDALSEDVKEYLKRIISATGNMQKLIDDLLAFSRTSSTEKILSNVDLNLLLAEVTHSLKYTIEELNVTITSNQLPTTKVIPFQFQQLLENIIGNAIKYAKVGVNPIINIEADNVSGVDHIEEGADPGKNYHRISITDNGIGFEQIYARKIFEIFQRLHGKSEYSGTGIGLAICKKIVENHKGFITAKGVEGQGATFNVFLPVE
ncbi:MAG: PAS domain S-box protein [Bacteroidota bacterium]